MIRNCPKCGYTRKASDAQVPDWQCPGCGIAYAKYLEQTQAPAVQRAPLISAPVAAPMSAKALFFILAGLVAVGYVGYDRFMSPKSKGQGAGGEGGQVRESGQILEVSNPAYYGTLEPGGPVLRMKPETLAQLHKLTPSQVVMFGTSWCPYCAKARALLAANGVRFSELDLEKDGAAEVFQRDVMGLSGFPTIVIGNRVTQGFDEGQILASLKEL
jgi:glutaredoxin